MGVIALLVLSHSHILIRHGTPVGSHRDGIRSGMGSGLSTCAVAVSVGRGIPCQVEHVERPLVAEARSEQPHGRAQARLGVGLVAPRAVREVPCRSLHLRACPESRWHASGGIMDGLVAL
eukprot:356038-Chlamydomonas_euryale.AAC.3